MDYAVCTTLPHKTIGTSNRFARNGLEIACDVERGMQLRDKVNAEMIENACVIYQKRTGVRLRFTLPD